MESTSTVRSFAQLHHQRITGLLEKVIGKVSFPAPGRRSGRCAPANPGYGLAPWPRASPSQQHRLLVDVLINAGPQADIVDKDDRTTQDWLKRQPDLDPPRGPDWTRRP